VYAAFVRELAEDAGERLAIVDSGWCGVLPR
jgi:hypothetical protein